jgi:hypothetical protein
MYKADAKKVFLVPVSEVGRSDDSVHAFSG